MRIERKKSEPSDYVATLKRLGFDPGPDGPVARGRALDAMRFVREQRRGLIASLCGDQVPFEETPTALPTQVAGDATPGAPGEPPDPADRPAAAAGRPAVEPADRPADPAPAAARDAGRRPGS